MKDSKNKPSSEKTLGEVEDKEIQIIDTIKDNLKHLRHIKNLSLDKLAGKCGVSRAMLSQIEQGKSAPTISVLWKIASGLNVSFGELLKEREAPKSLLIPYEKTKVLYSNSKTFSSRALFPLSEDRKTEFYELTLAPGGSEFAESHPFGTTENIVVVIGKLNVKILDMVFELSEKDSIFFRADVPHEYHNPSEQETLMYLVMEYKESIHKL